MKKVIVLSLALAAFLGAKEVDTAEIFLSDVKSMHALKSFLKKNKNDIVKLKLSYCVNENSMQYLEAEANKRKEDENYSRLGENFVMADGSKITYVGKNDDFGEGYDGDVNTGIEYGELMLDEPNSNHLKNIFLKVGDSNLGQIYKWEYEWSDEESESKKCKFGQVVLEGSFYVYHEDENENGREMYKYNMRPELMGNDPGDKYDAFFLDPIAKKYLKLLEYKK